ncbi:ABC transporter permease subunit, partial [Streptomyces sp. NPDC056405]|uniref:ABC transporter permease subunit n=1 Tax=Streptomyces sp. NPDC056405 TaxID=3345811 RepID=UPI0035E02D42
SQVETAQLEVAGSLGARPWRIVRTVILPEALPSLAAGGALVLVMCLNEFGIVLFTGAKNVVTLPVLVYTKAILDGDYTGACVVAVVNIVLSVALYALYRTVMARTGGTPGRRKRPRASTGAADAADTEPAAPATVGRAEAASAIPAASAVPTVPSVSPVPALTAGGADRARA